MQAQNSHKQEIDVSIIIPTYNRSALLKKTLDSLCSLLVPSNASFEAIVCDDGSSDNTIAVVKEFESSINLYYCYQSDRGYRAAAARNMGIRLARGKIAVFLDAGMFATPQFLKEHLTAHELVENSVSIGLICGIGSETVELWNSISLENPYWWERITRENLLPDPRISVWASMDFHIKNLTAPWVFLWSGNFSVMRQSMLEVGGFDESFEGWGAEDIDLGYRLHKLGLQFQVNEAIAIHLPHETTRDLDIELRNKKRIYMKDPNLVTELLATCRDLQFSEDVDEICYLARCGLTPDYLNIWNSHLQKRVKNLLGEPCFVFGAGTGDLAGFLNCAFIGDPDQENVHRLRNKFPWLNIRCCLGINTGMAPNSIETVLITDFWRAFNEHAVLRIMQEATKIALHVFLLYTPGYKILRSNSAPIWDQAHFCKVITNAGFIVLEHLHNDITEVYKIVKSNKDWYIE